MAQPTPDSPIRVLVADDQRINRIILRRQLDPSKYEVVEAENGREALEKFDASQPDVVLLDVMMPVMNGFEATRAIKQRLGHDHVPIILITARNDEDSLSEGFAAGADDFVPKPVNKVVLESRLQAALRIRNLFQTLNLSRDELKFLHAQAHREQVMAAKLMAGVLRTAALEHPMFKYRTQPMDVFNGDLLMAGETAGGRYRVVLGDFAGHGLAAAIGSLPLVTEFERLCRLDLSLKDFAQTANTNLRAVLPRDRFLAAVFIDIDPGNRAIEVINAGMPPVLVRQKGGSLRTRVESTHLPLAITEDLIDQAASAQLALEPEDRIYIYSDGVTEALNPNGEAFGEERLQSLISDGSDGQNTFEATLSIFDAFIEGAPPEDDVTLLEIYPDFTGAVRPVQPKEDRPLVSRISIEVAPEMLRQADVNQLLDSWLQGIKFLDGHRAAIFAIVTELLNNAIDHGLLRLSSSMKHDLSGFQRYYEERERRLATLEEGRVDVLLEVSRRKSHWQLDIDIEDSGPGFDLTKDQAGTDDQAHGRGITMVRGLCKSLEYQEPGNRVRASYTWEEPANEDSSSPGPNQA